MWLINQMQITQPSTINSSLPSAAYMRQWMASIGSGNGLAPVWCQAIICTNTALLSIGPLGTMKLESKYKTLHSWKYNMKTLSAKWGPFCPGRWVKSYNKHLIPCVYWCSSKCLWEIAALLIRWPTITQSSTQFTTYCYSLLLPCAV